MRTLTAGMQTHLQGGLTTLALGWIIVRQDGTTYRYTNHDRPKTLGAPAPTIAQGTYLRGPMESVNAVQVSLDMSVNNLDLNGFFIPNEIEENEIVARLFDRAKVYVHFYNWANPAHGIGRLLRGQIGGVRRKGHTFSVEFRSLSQYFQFNLVSLISPSCRSAFGATGIGPANGCRYHIDPPAWQASHTYEVEEGGRLTDVKPSVENGYQYRFEGTVGATGVSGGSEPTWDTTPGGTTVDGGVTWTTIRATKRTATVTAVASRREFTVDSILGDLTPGTHGSADGGFFAPGTAQFIDGDNADLNKRIGSFTDAGGGTYVVHCKDQFPYLPQVGDDLYLIGDCDQTFESCKVLGNYKNFRGERKVPGPDKLFKVHSPDGSKK